MQALLGTRAKESLDLRAHLKQVKKEDTEKVSVASARKRGAQRRRWGATLLGPKLGAGGTWSQGEKRLVRVLSRNLAQGRKEVARSQKVPEVYTRESTREKSRAEGEPRV